MNRNAYPEALGYLTRLKGRGVSLGLERMRVFAAAIGDPQRAVPCIHVAGTNGKGSVAAMLEAILRAAGWRVGLYTSPHLVRLGERVQVDRRALGEEEIIRHVAALAPVADALEAPPSYFEFMTGLAFRHFAEARCDIAVIEVGLGGRLDATNIIEPEVCAITSIGLDHCEQLGSTLGAIAGEKAGIIKSGVPVVLGRLPREAEGVIRKIAAERGARVRAIKEEFSEANWPTTNLPGDYQRLNAATATLVARTLPGRWRVTAAIVADALQRVDWAARWQRFELEGARRLILDASHNAEGATVLDRNLAQLVAETGRAPVVVVGVLGLARARPLLEVIARHAREIHLVVPAQGRACTAAELRSAIPASFAGTVAESSVAALFPGGRRCRLGGAGDAVVVTGSIYLAGEVLGQLEPTRGEAEGRLQDF